MSYNFRLMLMTVDVARRSESSADEFYISTASSAGQRRESPKWLGRADYWTLGALRRYTFSDPRYPGHSFGFPLLEGRGRLRLFCQFWEADPGGGAFDGADYLGGVQIDLVPQELPPEIAPVATWAPARHSSLVGAHPPGATSSRAAIRFTGDGCDYTAELAFMQY